MSRPSNSEIIQDSFRKLKFKTNGVQTMLLYTASQTKITFHQVVFEFGFKNYTHCNLIRRD